MTGLGRYDRELALNAPGWTLEGLLQANPQMRNIISLGPNAAINENILALRHPERQFTVIDQDADILQSSVVGKWSLRDIRLETITATERKRIIREAGMEGIFLEADDGIVRTKYPLNLHHIVGTYPLPLTEPYDLCLAFNSLPAEDKGTKGVFHWIFREVLTERGFFANEWGVFQKSEHGIRRIEHGDRERKTDHVIDFLSPYCR